MFNLVMIREGYAHEYTYRRNPNPYRYQAEFEAAEVEAREQQRGLWSPSTCNGDTEQPADATRAPPPTARSGPGEGTAKPQGRDCPPETPIKGNRGQRNE